MQSQQGAAIFVGRGNVQEAKLVGAGLVIDDGLLHRIAGIAQAFKIDALDHAAAMDIEAGDDADGQHGEA